MDNVIWIDPGLEGTGWAAFRDGCRDLRASGVLRPPKGERWQNQCHSLASMLHGALTTAWFVTHSGIEMPELWSGSSVSMASATHRSKRGEPSDLFKLLYLVGVLSSTLLQRTGNLPVLVAPSKWKGQLSKEQVMRRIARTFPKHKFRDHEADAVGMGLAEGGRL